MTKIISRKDAAAILEVRENTVAVYASRGVILKYAPNEYDHQSVLDYLGKRDNSRRRSSVGSAPGISIQNRRRLKNDIVTGVYEHFEIYGCPPIYDWLAERVKLAKSGIGRYVMELARDGRLEIYNGRIYLPGLRKDIQERAKTMRRRYEMANSAQT